MKDTVTRGDLGRAKRRALAIFDEWRAVTGFELSGSYLEEIEGIIEDAVEIGIQCAYGINKELTSEEK